MSAKIVTDDRIAKFVSTKLGAPIVPPFTCMGIEDDSGDLIGGVVFNCFDGINIHLTIAGHGWRRSFCKAVGSYVFETLGCERFTLTTESPLVARLGERLGGRVEGVMRNNFGKNRDAFLVGVLKSEYRFK